MRTSAEQTHIPCVTWTKAKKEGVNSGRSDALKPDKLGLSCKANKYSEAGNGELGLLPTHEPSVMKMTVYVTPGKPRFNGTSIDKLN